MMKFFHKPVHQKKIKFFIGFFNCEIILTFTILKTPQMKQLNCIIIDDEMNAREALESLINRYLHESLKVRHLCESVQQGVSAINKFHPDLVFLDIEMPKENGYELFKYFDPVSFDVIFVTAHEKYVSDALKFHAFDYLLKPVSHFELIETIKRYQNTKASN